VNKSIRLVVTALELTWVNEPFYVLQEMERKAYERLGTIRQESELQWYIDVPHFLPGKTEFQNIPGLVEEYPNAVFVVEVKVEDDVRV
jgi:hypothetical protein